MSLWKSRSAIYFVALCLAFCATCGSVASWRNN